MRWSTQRFRVTVVLDAPRTGSTRPPTIEWGAASDRRGSVASFSGQSHAVHFNLDIDWVVCVQDGLGAYFSGMGRGHAEWGKLAFARSKSNTARALLAATAFATTTRQLVATSFPAGNDPFPIYVATSFPAGTTPFPTTPFPFMLRPPSLPTAAGPADCFAPSLQRS